MPTSSSSSGPSTPQPDTEQPGGRASKEQGGAAASASIPTSVVEERPGAAPQAPADLMADSDGGADMELGFTPLSPSSWRRVRRGVWEQWLPRAAARSGSRQQESLDSLQCQSIVTAPSALRRYSPKCSSTLAIDRIIEKTLLRCSGVQGDGSDDRLLLCAWSEIFGGIQRDKFTFEYRDRLRRIKLYPLGGGSMVLNRHLKKRQLLRKRWSIAHMRALPRIGAGAATNKWLCLLNRKA